MTAEMTPSQSEASNAPIRILVVEDNPVDFLLLENALAADPENRFALTHTERLDESLQKVRQDEFDIVLLDLGLPDSRGLETFSTFHEQAPTLPLVVFSGNVDEQDAMQAVRAGAQDYLVKSLAGFEMAGRAIRHAIERQKLTLSLQESEKRFATAFHSSPACQMITTTPESRIIDVNEAFCRLMGYERAELIGRTTLELSFWADSKEQEAVFATFRAEGRIGNREVAFRTRSGAERTVLASVEPIEIKGMPCVISTVVDITERKQAEEQLRLLTDRQSALLSAVPDIIAEVDTNKIYTWVNAAGIEFFGEDVVGKEAALYFADEQDVYAAVQPLFDGEKDDTYIENWQRRKDGEKRLLAWHCRALKDADGRVYGTLSSAHDLTTRKQTEEKIIALQEFSRATIDALSAHLCVLDESGVIISVNQAWRDFADANPPTPEDHYVGTNYLTACENAQGKAAAEAAAVAQGIRAVMSGQREHFQIEYPCHSPEENRWFVAKVTRFIESGAVRIVVAHENITERKLAEEALSASERKLRLISENITDSIFAYDMERRLIYANPAIEKLTGYSLQELWERNFINWLHPEDEPRMMKRWEEIYAGRGFSGEEFRIITKAGQVKWLQGAWSPMLDEQGQQVGIQGRETDITERKQAEEALKESEERLVLVLEGSQLGYWDWNIETGEVRRNKRWAEMLGYTLPEIELNVKQWTDLHHPDDTATAWQSIQDHLAGRTPAHHSEYRMRCKNGEYKWILDHARVVKHDPQGKPLRMCGTHTDITERKQVEQAIYWMSTTQQQMAASDSLTEIYQLVGKNIQELIGDGFVGVTALDETAQAMRIIGLYGLGSTLEKWVRKLGADPTREAYPLNEMTADELRAFRSGKLVRFEGGLYRLLLGKVPKPLCAAFMKQMKLQGIYTMGFVEQEVHFGGVTIFARKDITPLKEMIETIIHQATIVIKRIKTRQALQARTDDLARLLAAGRAFSETLDIQQIYATIFKYVQASVPCNTLIISAYDPQTQMITCEYVQNEAGPQDISTLPPIPLGPPGKGTQSRVIHSGESMLIPDYVKALQTSQTRYDFDDQAQIVEEIPEDAERTRSAILVPLKVEGQIAGVLQVFSYRQYAHNADHLRFVEALAFHISAGISNARLFGELEARVRQRTAEVQDLYDNAPTGYHSLDANGCYVQINQTEANWLGYARQELLNQPFTDFVTSESLKIFEANYPEFKQRGSIHDMEFEMIRKDGSTFPVLVNATATYDEQGHFLMSRSTMFDNTEQKRIEISLRESERQNRLLFEESPDAVVLFDEDGRVVRMNRAFETLTGYSTDKLVGRTLEKLDLLPADQIAKLAEAVTLALQVTHKFVPAEFKIERASGEVRDVGVRVFGVNIQGSQHYLTTLRDITVEKQVEETLRLANMELERALRMKDEFLANMSHELRTPLNAILGISESLLEQVAGPLNEKQLKYLNTIAESGRHLLSLINDILDLAKINAGRFETEMAKVNVASVAETSLRMVRELAQKKQLNVELKIDELITIIWTDERRLKQILVNLLSNAVKFTDPGGHLGLHIQGDTEHNILHFTVWDTGIGIHPDELPRLFQPFVQLDSGLARGSQGTGLGLVLVSQMARLLGGSVNVKSQPGQGSRFTVLIPWAMAAQTGTLNKAELAPLPAQPPSQEMERPTILLIEDTESVIMMVHDYLDMHGYEVIVARNGFEGIEKAARQRPDLIIMDIMMPEMGGLETTRHLRQEPELEHTPIIALTALAMPGDRQRCLEAGMNDYLSKPVKWRELLQTIERHLPTQKEKINEKYNLNRG